MCACVDFFFMPPATCLMRILFRHNSRVLITTDVWARGIDVQQISLVINFDLPNNRELYIHRIGRSGALWFAFYQHSLGKQLNAIQFHRSFVSQVVSAARVSQSTSSRATNSVFCATLSSTTQPKSTKCLSIVSVVGFNRRWLLSCLTGMVLVL